MDRAEAYLSKASRRIERAHGADSPEFGTILSNFGALLSTQADTFNSQDLRAKALDYKRRAFAITFKTCGPRHPKMAVCYQSLAVSYCAFNNIPAALINAERGFAVMLSLDLGQHPAMQPSTDDLTFLWDQSGQPDKAARLRAGDISYLLPVIAQVEVDHRIWVAEDPAKRHFGPPSFFVTTPDAVAFTLDTLGIPEADRAETLRRLKRDEAFADDLARRVAEALAPRAGSSDPP